MSGVSGFDLPFAEAIRFFLGKVNVGTRRWDDVWKAGHARAFMVAGVQSEDMLMGVRGALQRAIAEGETLDDFKKRLKPMMQGLGWESRGRGYAAWRVRLVFETNLRTAYAAGEYEQLTDPDVLAAMPYWRYRHSGSKDPRPQHVAWDGLVLRHNDPWWQTHYPPNGWGCDCSVEPLSDRDLERLGKSGPDKAPDIVRRPWTDPVSGRSEQVPLGIDPGWDYNVGAAWREARDLPATPYTVPEGFGGPAPSPPAPSAAPPAVPEPGPVGQTGAAAGAAMVRRPRRRRRDATVAGTPPALPSREEVSPIARFLADPSEAPLDLGEAAAPLRAALNTSATRVLLSADTARKQRERHPDLTDEEYQLIPAMLTDAPLILRQNESRVVVLSRAGRLYLLAVKKTGDDAELYVVSFHRVRRDDLPRLLARNVVLHGSVSAIEGEDGAPVGPPR